ncbi:MAG: hypothetical protein M3N19_00415 [Candidatus Eremiobacteraeota bacterium]|nr:hypothetical protein [Candidatus Eremiobacteraeota bacterium]
MKKPDQPALSYELAPGAFAMPCGLLWLERTRTLIAADAHFAYEDVIGGALPLWSTAETAATLTIAAKRLGALEILLLGDIIHGSVMSPGAAASVAVTLQTLRSHAEVILIAGNHEGRSRGIAVLGETFEFAVRDGWTLLHGDKPPVPGTRSIIGHLHPSLHMGRGASVPAFLAGSDLIIVPALTPYSPGLDVCSDACIAALAPWDVGRRDLHVVASTAERVFPFGTLSALRQTIKRPYSGKPNRFRRKYLRPDS